MRKIGMFLVVVLIGVFFIRMNSTGKIITSNIKSIVTNSFNSFGYINKEGNTIATRVKVPEGFKRVSYTKGSFQSYLRNYKLKEYGTAIINFDGSTYFAQNWHDAILDVPVPKNGLQQCADVLMRVRAEYLWEQDRKKDIGFKFTSGHYCSWQKYAAGYRPKIKGNKVSFHKTASVNHTKANFYKYLNLIYTYAGTASLHAELKKVSLENLKIGDMLVQPGFPGHIEMIVDVVVNDKGEYLFLLAQGNTPAQNMCLLKNFEDELSPWYNFKDKETIYTPSYYFENPVFVRFY